MRNYYGKQKLTEDGFAAIKFFLNKELSQRDVADITGYSNQVVSKVARVDSIEEYKKVYKQPSGRDYLKTRENIKIIRNKIEQAVLDEPVKNILIDYIDKQSNIWGVAICKDQIDIMIYQLEHINKWIVSLFDDVDKYIEKLRD